MVLLLSGLAGVIGILYLFVKFKLPWLPSDLRSMTYLIRCMKILEQEKKSNILPIDVFEKTADKYADKAMVIYKNERYSFRLIDLMANKFANVVLNLGLKQGDTVAMLMYNEPAFIWSWFGLEKIGIEVAFLNFHQKKQTLLYSIKTSGAKAVFLSKGSDLYAAIEDIAPELENIDLYTFESPNRDVPDIFKSLTAAIESAAGDRISREHRSRVSVNSTNCLIFTSGTTGLPKPAIVTQFKTLNGSIAYNYCDVSADDILYEPLPLYHSAASLIGVGTCIRTGVTMVLVEKFSASRFFKDCHDHKVTMIHYVGEMCRYLVSSPTTPYDTDHNIKVALGNGMRKDIWTNLQTRFKIKTIVEFYGATELPFGMLNIYGKVGAIGRISPFLKKVLPVDFIKLDEETEQPVRNKNGKIYPCKTRQIFALYSAGDTSGTSINCLILDKRNESKPGLFIIRLDNKIPFEGYKNKEEATKRKVIHDVFVRGDSYAVSGDLMYTDEEYYIYFYDRMGDTFRWKGENVSTTEISNIIAELPFISDACVYGVTVPGCEGRAGMATIILSETEDKKPMEEIISGIEDQCIKVLPGYAIPRFLRFRQVLDITSTFKQLKSTLKKEGFDLDLVHEPIYYFDVKNQKYTLLDKENETKIKNQELQL